jgi:hypothetical protein
MSVGRREARRSALTLLYQWDVTEQAPGDLYEGEIGEYARDVTAAVVRDVVELDGRPTGSGRSSGTSSASRSTSSTKARFRRAR